MEKSPEFYWDIYRHEVELHRGYIDLVMKINTFYYAITGAILSYYFIHINDHPAFRHVLVLAFCMTVALAVFFFRSARASMNSNERIEFLSKKLEFDNFSLVASVLASLLRIFGSMLVLIAVGVFFLYFNDTF